MPKRFCYCGAGPDAPCPCEEEARRQTPSPASNAVTPETLFGEGFSRPDLDASRRIWQQQDADEADQRARLIREIQQQELKNRF